MRHFENKSNPYKKGKLRIDVDIDSTGRMGTKEGETTRLAITTSRGRETGVYLTEAERHDLIRSLLHKQEGEWLIGFPTEKVEMFNGHMILDKAKTSLGYVLLVAHTNGDYVTTFIKDPTDTSWRNTHRFGSRVEAEKDFRDRCVRGF